MITCEVCGAEAVQSLETKEKDWKGRTYEVGRCNTHFVPKESLEDPHSRFVSSTFPIQKPVDDKYKMKLRADRSDPVNGC